MQKSHTLWGFLPEQKEVAGKTLLDWMSLHPFWDKNLNKGEKLRPRDLWVHLYVCNPRRPVPLFTWPHPQCIPAWDGWPSWAPVAATVFRLCVRIAASQSLEPQNTLSSALLRHYSITASDLFQKSEGLRSIQKSWLFLRQQKTLRAPSLTSSL